MRCRSPAGARRALLPADAIAYASCRGCMRRVKDCDCDDTSDWPDRVRLCVDCVQIRGLYTVVPVMAGLSVLVRAGDAGECPHRLTATAPAADPPRGADMPVCGC